MTLKEILIRLGVDVSPLNSGMANAETVVGRSTDNIASRLQTGLTAPMDSAGKAAIGTGMSFDAAKGKVSGAASFMESKVTALGVGVGAALGGVAFKAIEIVGQEMLEAARKGQLFAQLSPAFDRLAESIGSTREAMLSTTRAATKGLIGDLEIMQAVNKGVLLGLPMTAESMGTMAKTATILGRAMGQDATKSLDDLITALGRSSPLILDNLGLSVSLTDAYEDYARQLGKSAGALTDAEKKMAFYSAAMTAAEQKVDELGDVQLTLTDQIGRLGTTLSNTVTEWTANANGAGIFSRAIGGLNDMLEQSISTTGDLIEARRRIFERGDWVVTPWKLVDEMDVIQAERMASIAKGLSADMGSLARSRPIEAMTATQAEIKALEESSKLISKATEEAKKLTEANKKLAESYREIAEEAIVDINYAEFARGREQAELFRRELTMLGGVKIGLPKMDTGLMQLELRQLEQTFSGLKIGDAVLSGITPPPSAWKSFGQEFSAELGGVILGAVQGGGNVGGAMGGLFGQSLAKNLFGQGAQKALEGALGKTIGGAIGSVIPGIGTLIGSLGGQLIGGLFGKMFGGEGRKANDLRDQIIASAGGFDELARKAVEAGTSIDGLLKAKDVKGVEAAWAALNAKLKEHGTEAAAAAAAEEQRAENAKAFTSEFPSLLNQVADSGRLASAQLLGMVQQVEGMGEAGIAASEFVTSSVQTALGGLTGFLEGAKLGSQASASAMSSAIGASFTELQARGMSFTQALAAISPAVDALTSRLERSGFEGGEAFSQIQAFVALAKDEVAGPMLNAVSGLNNAFVGLHNAGLMNQEMFAGLAGQVADTFGTLQAEGYDGDAVLRSMQPTLQTIWEMQQDFGHVTDEATQALLDQGLQAGILGDQHREANERTALAMERVAGLLEDFIGMLVGDVPAAAGAAADGVSDQLARIRVPQVRIPYWFTAQNSLPGGTSSGPAAFAEGGIVTAPTYGVFGEAGPEAIMPLDRVSDFIESAGGGRDDEILEALEAVHAAIERMPAKMARASMSLSQTRPR